MTSFQTHRFNLFHTYFLLGEAIVDVFLAGKAIFRRLDALAYLVAIGLHYAVVALFLLLKARQLSLNNFMTRKFATTTSGVSHHEIPGDPPLHADNSQS